MAGSAAPAPAPTEARVATEYVVIQKRELTDEGGKPVTAWVEMGNTNTPTKDGAVKAVVGDKEGLWKALPMRSWSGSIKTSVEKITRTKAEVVDD